MTQDYLIIGVDPEKRYAIRFLCLEQGMTQSLELKQLPAAIIPTYRQLLVGSVLLGSRGDDRESALYKLHLTDSGLRINCEVSPLGTFRSALFPQAGLDHFSLPLEGTLQVSILNRKDQIYSSTTTIASDVAQTFRDYLQQSVQTDSLLLLHDHYALWIERLPDTSDQDWNEMKTRFSSEGFFHNHLLPFPIRILALTKPKLTCACRLESFQSAIAALPKQELLELFMEGKVESRCDYCNKLWTIDETFLSELLATSRNEQ